MTQRKRNKVYEVWEVIAAAVDRGRRGAVKIEARTPEGAAERFVEFHLIDGLAREPSNGRPAREVTVGVSFPGLDQELFFSVTAVPEWHYSTMEVSEP